MFRSTPALVTYAMAGDPDLPASERTLMACIEACADAIEIGMPFTDPVADGPVIQAAHTRALAAGTTTKRVLDLAARIHSRAPDVPIVLMGYLNPILAMGEQRFFEACEASGVSAVLCPDFPADHAFSFEKKSVFVPRLVAPTTPLDRIDFIARVAAGFLYYVSVTGTTGARRELPSDLASRLAAVRARSSLPVVVGFGVQSAEQVRALARHADGVVVGSAIVSRASNPSSVHAFVSSLKSGIAEYLSERTERKTDAEDRLVGSGQTVEPSIERGAQ